MDCIYIALLSKALFSASHSPIHTHIHTPTAVSTMQQATASRLGARWLGALLRDTSGTHLDNQRGGSGHRISKLPVDRQTCSHTSVWEHVGKCHVRALGRGGVHGRFKIKNSRCLIVTYGICSDMYQWNVQQNTTDNTNWRDQNIHNIYSI